MEHDRSHLFNQIYDWYFHKHVYEFHFIHFIDSIDFINLKKTTFVAPETRAIDYV
jgi:hypothetical protein